MKRALVVVLIILTIALAAYLFNQYWTHRYDSLIVRQATIYRVDPDLVWSIIYEETYFAPWKIGRDAEIGLMQVTPTVAREWIAKLAAAIRRHDRDHMITVGLVDWSLDRPGLSSRFVPEKIAGELDFASWDNYPAFAPEGSWWRPALSADAGCPGGPRCVT